MTICKSWLRKYIGWPSKSVNQLLARRSECSDCEFDIENRLSDYKNPKFDISYDYMHALIMKICKLTLIFSIPATSAPIRVLKSRFWPRKSIPRPKKPKLDTKIVKIVHWEDVINYVNVVCVHPEIRCCLKRPIYRWRRLVWISHWHPSTADCRRISLFYCHLYTNCQHLNVVASLPNAAKVVSQHFEN